VAVNHYCYSFIYPEGMEARVQLACSGESNPEPPALMSKHTLTDYGDGSQCETAIGETELMH